MEIKQLYNDLTAAYSAENLNKITRKLIVHYKAKDYATIRSFANKMSKYIDVTDEKDARCFSKMMMLYHPDKGDGYRREIQQIYEQNNFEKLQKFSHIFVISGIESATVAVVDEAVGFNPEYVWETESDDDETDLYNDGYSDYCNHSDFEKSFFNLIKIREYGRIDIEIPTYYFEDFEEFEMAESGLESLDGVEYCIHVKILDVSTNNLTDISNLWELNLLEELYLANNEIGYIDALSNLTNLKMVDLSGNQIDDISPLFDLEKLEYVNLIENKVPQQQIEKLKAKGVVVMV